MVSETGFGKATELFSQIKKTDELLDSPAFLRYFPASTLVKAFVICCLRQFREFR